MHNRWDQKLNQHNLGFATSVARKMVHGVPLRIPLLLVSSKVTLLDSFSSFQIFGFSGNSKEFLANGPYASNIGLSIITLFGTEFIISHTFQCERYFSFACPVKFDSCIIGVILLDTVPNIIKLL